MRKLLFAILSLIAVPAAAQPQQFTLASPDGTNVVTLTAGGAITYSVARRGETVIDHSPIVLELDSGAIGYGVAVTSQETSSANATYNLVVGKASTARDHYNQLILHLEERGGAKRKMDVIARAYDDGIAFRTLIPVQPATAAALVRYERTGFNFPSPWKCWGFNVGKFGSSHEGEFDPVDTTRTRDHNLFSLPFLCETQKAAFALTEADLLDFAGMYLTGRGDGGLGLQLKLSPSLADPRIAVRTRIGSPIVTPWRVVMLADKAGELTQSNLITSLSTPSRIEDTSWIKPGLAVWDWWNGPVIAGYRGSAPPPRFPRRSSISPPRMGCPMR